MNPLEREIRERRDAAAADVLRGAATDYAEYKTALARYQVLKELTDFADDLRKTDDPGDPEDE